jgi:GcrA cell cycle regulator
MADHSSADQPAKDAPVSWTDERVELLRKLWLDGLSASRIAAELAGGVTRNAVIGKVHRLGLSGRVKPQTATVGARMRSAAAAPSSGGRSQLTARSMTMPVRGNTALAPQMRAMAAPALSPFADAADVVVPITAAVTIMELRESMCRWPVGDPASAEFRYCGGKAPIGEGPYCAYHSRMAYQPSHDRRHRKSA